MVIQDIEFLPEDRKIFFPLKMNGFNVLAIFFAPEAHQKKG